MVLEFSWFTYVILPVLIFIARVLDVSIGTIRLIFVNRGNKGLAPLLGFFEVLIWLLAIQQIMQNLSNPITYVAYAGGFATGTWVGMILEERLGIGKVMLRVITDKDASKLSQALSAVDYVVTTSEGTSKSGEVGVVFCILERKHLQKALLIINKHNPKAFFSVADVRYANSPHLAKMHRKEFRQGK